MGVVHVGEHNPAGAQLSGSNPDLHGSMAQSHHIKNPPRDKGGELNYVMLWRLNNILCKSCPGQVETNRITVWDNIGLKRGYQHLVTHAAHRANRAIGKWEAGRRRGGKGGDGVAGKRGGGKQCSGIERQASKQVGRQARIGASQ